MADFPHTSSQPTKEQDIASIPLPEGDRSAEQRKIADTAYQQHSRRENQEEHLLLQEAHTISQVSLTSGGANSTVKNASRSREQNNQLSQQDEHTPKLGKRGKNRRGDNDHTLHQLTSVVGPESAESIVCAVEEATKKHGSGLTVNPGDLKQLAKELAATLQGSGGLHTLGISTTNKEDLEKIILHSLTESCCEHKGVLTPSHVFEEILNCKKREDSQPDSTPARVHDIKSRVAAIVAASSTPVEEIVRFKGTLPKNEKKLVLEAITRIEIDEENSFLYSVITRYAKSPEVYSSAIDTFVDNLVEKTHQETYTKAYLSRAMEGENLRYNALLEERINLRKEVEERTARIQDLQARFLKRIREGEDFFGCKIVPHEDLALYKSCPITSDTFCHTHEQLVHGYVASVRELLEERKIHGANPEFARFSELSQLLLDENATLKGIHVGLLDALAQLENLQGQILNFWSDFSILHARAFERAKIPAPTVRVAGQVSEPYNLHYRSHISSSSAWSPFLTEGNLHKKIVTLDSHSGGGKSLHDDSPHEKSEFELREEADREGRISIEIAKHFAFNGDFANAEAAVSAHNNRFPEFQISRDFIREIKEKLAQKKNESSVEDHVV